MLPGTSPRHINAPDHCQTAYPREVVAAHMAALPCPRLGFGPAMRALHARGCRLCDGSNVISAELAAALFHVRGLRGGRGRGRPLGRPGMMGG
jgi:hypothetical protein